MGGEQQQFLSVSGGRWLGGELVHPPPPPDESFAQRARERTEVPASRGGSTPGGRIGGRTGGRHTVLRKPIVERGLM